MQHWSTRYTAQVITAPRYNEQRSWSPQQMAWLTRHRQIIETTFALMDRVMGIKHLQAHSRWGHYTRLAVKTSAYNLGLWLNRLLQRPLLSLETLIC